MSEFEHETNESRAKDLSRRRFLRFAGTGLVAASLGGMYIIPEKSEEKPISLEELGGVGLFGMGGGLIFASLKERFRYPTGEIAKSDNDIQEAVVPATLGAFLAVFGYILVKPSRFF